MRHCARRGVRVYLTLNTLVKPRELSEAVAFLGEAIDRGVDAAIVQDIGLVRLIQRTYRGFEIHGSTQMSVHDASGAVLMQRLGVDRVVLARENTIADIAEIHSAVPSLGLETFIHGALCISYSGQCFMSGMISERSANRGSCAQSCRKGYTLRDEVTGETLDEGFVISARDLGAYDSLAGITDAGVGCLKIEGRKKRPEYVATVTGTYRDMLSRVARGETVTASPEEVQPLVQIFSRGFTPGMYRGRAGRDYITRDQPDNRGVELGVVVHVGREIVVDVSAPIAVGDGLAFGSQLPGTEQIGSSVSAVRTVGERRGGGDVSIRQALTLRVRPAVGDTVIRTSDATLLDRARASFETVALPAASRRRVDVAAFGAAGSPLKLLFRSDAGEITVRSEIPLVPATRRSLDGGQLREQLGRLGETEFALGDVSVDALAAGLFIPVSELNRMRQYATAELAQRLAWDGDAARASRDALIAASVSSVSGAVTAVADGEMDWAPVETRPGLSAQVYNTADARAAAAAGATEIVFDPFIRHPPTPLNRVRALAVELAESDVALRIRTPTIIRPPERASVDRWLGLGFAVMSGHAGLVAELGADGRDVVADYAVNCFNQHTAAEFFQLGASGIVPSIELTVAEIIEVSQPWHGRGFQPLVYGRPEGMTIEHCVLSAAFDREPTTCRDLCVQKHTNVALTDPAGYTFAVATDSACRNRLLHSRPLDASEFVPRLWSAGIRSYQLVFNVAGDDVAGVTRGFRALIDALEVGAVPAPDQIRRVVGPAFTRGHFARAV